MVTGEVLPLPGGSAHAGGPGVGARAAVAGCIAFAMIGLQQAVYGPAIPELREDFGISAAVAGLALSANFAGAMTGIVVSGVLEERVALNVRLTVAMLFAVVGAPTFALALVFPLALAGSFAMGAGFGTLDLGFSALVAAGFGARSGAMSNLLHACFGAGAVTGPLLIGAFSEYGFRPLMIAGAAIALALIPLTLSIHAPGQRHVEAQAAPAQRSIRLGAIAGFVVLFFLYTGTETSIGGWEPTHLQALGHTEGSAATLTAFFWGALTLGRLAGVPLSLRLAPARFLLGAGVLLVAALALAHASGAAPVAYAVAGVACAPVFPTGLVWLLRAVPRTRGATALVIGAANVGAVILPAAVGAIVTGADAGAIPTALLVLAAAMLTTTVALAVSTRRDGESRAPIGEGTNGGPATV